MFLRRNTPSARFSVTCRSPRFLRIASPARQQRSGEEAKGNSFRAEPQNANIEKIEDQNQTVMKEGEAKIDVGLAAGKESKIQQANKGKRQ